MSFLGKSYRRRSAVRAPGSWLVVGCAALAGCDGTSGLDQTLLAVFGAPVSWVDPAEVGPSSRTSGPFGISVPLPIETQVRNSVAGTIVSPAEAMTYQIGPVQAGDDLTIDVVAQDAGFDPAVAVFDAGLDLINFNDDRNYFGRDTDASVRFTVREPSDEYYVVVAASVHSDTTGDYHLHVTLTPEHAVDGPHPQIVYLEFHGGDNVVIGGRAPVDVPVFSGDMIDPVFSDDTDKLIRQTVERVRGDYAPYDVIIVSSSEEPPPSEPHTTVFFGSYNPTLLGLADSVDAYNLHPVQEAIVFVDTFTVFMSQQPTLEEMADALGNVASHEIGHLVGLHHTRDPHGIMDTSATLRQMLRRQAFARSPLNGDTFLVGYQNAPDTLLENVGGDPEAAHAAAETLRAKTLDPWYDEGPQIPVREMAVFGTGCGGH